MDDTGVGIPPEALKRLGERFYRGDPRQARATEGAGLGLRLHLASPRPTAARYIAIRSPTARGRPSPWQRRAQNRDRGFARLDRSFRWATAAALYWRRSCPRDTQRGQECQDYWLASRQL